MFKLKTKKWGEIEVSFLHKNKKGIIFDTDKNIIHHNGETICRLFNQVEVNDDCPAIAVGRTVVSLQDQYNKETGRKISLARALKDLGATRKQRVQFWKKYFQTQEDAREKAKETRETTIIL